MEILIKTFIILEGYYLKHSFDLKTRNPLKYQNKFLLKIINKNKNTEYGNNNNFKKLSSIKEFQKNIPINSYIDLEPYITKILNGGKNILTSETPIIFNQTSGTSNKPKYIPLTTISKKRNSLTMYQWLYRALLDHTHFLNKNSLLITSAAVEGYTPSGIPYGSLSGLIYKKLPLIVRKSYALPYACANIQNYDLRYYIMARLALEKDISFLATPNPTTLIKIAETCMKYQSEIIQSIYDGCLYSKLDFNLCENDKNIVTIINAYLKPNKSRSNFCYNIIKKHKNLIPFYCWPSLKLIGCWLGGSVGYHAEQISKYYGDIPKRDLGYLASEGCFTVPYKDNSPAGILALQNNFYEFIQEEDINCNNPAVVLSNELEIGKNYKILVTNESGLYRYDINDIIKVEDFYNDTPVISFVSKTGDFLNITGEKLHLNQILLALKKISNKFNIIINQFRIVPNQQELRYDIFLQLGNPIAKDVLENLIIPSIDSNFCDLNIEYSQKRKSKRLKSPCLHIMDPKWEEDVKKEFIASGKRDIQYKWQPVSKDIINSDKKYILFTIKNKSQ